MWAKIHSLEHSLVSFRLVLFLSYYKHIYKISIHKARRSSKVYVKHYF